MSTGDVHDDNRGLGQSSSTRTTTTTTMSAAKIPQGMTSTTSQPSGPSSLSKEADQVKSTIISSSLKDEDLEKLTKEELVQLIQGFKTKLKELQAECDQGVESRDRLKEQLLKAEGRENLILLRLAAKEREMADLIRQVRDMKKALTPGDSLFEKIRVDPAVNLVFEKMKKEVADAKVRVEEMQSELSAWKFTPDSNMGKRLMAKCKQLYQENEDLGRMISSGKIAKLENELSFQKNFAEEIKKSQSEIDDFLVELDEDFDGMQTTICSLQAQLQEAKEQLKSSMPLNGTEHETDGTDEKRNDGPQSVAAGDTVPNQAANADASKQQETDCEPNEKKVRPNDNDKE